MKSLFTNVFSNVNNNSWNANVVFAPSFDAPFGYAGSYDYADSNINKIKC